MRRPLFHGLLALALAPAVAHAQSARDPAARERVFMLSENARFVDVVDSFDEGSTFGFRLSAGYGYQRRTATIEREMRVSDPLSSAGTVLFARAAEYAETTNTLHLNAEIGLFHDLALTFGVPLVLSNSRELNAPSSPTPNDGANALFDGWTQDGRPTSLLALPFRAPTRSGVDQVRLGLAWSILSQARDRTKPTWTVRFEWRPPVGGVMNACNASPGPNVESCPAPSSVPSVPSSGINAMGAPTRPRSAGDPGISRGLHGVYFQTAVARRFGFVEPYAALDVLAEFPLRDTPFRYLDAPYGQLATFPPIQGSLTIGAEITPWENRETWQRVMIDARFRGTYRSQGRDYSPLYDALGSSTSRTVAVPACPANVRNDDGSCPPSNQVFFDGLTGVQSHVLLNGQLSIAAQPAKFVRIDLGVGLSWVSPHLITATDACNPNETVPASNPEWRGGCVNDSAPDPTHRPAIDQPGGRFRTNGETLFDFFATVSFTPRFF